jgi:hypothetical protein
MMLFLHVALGEANGVPASGGAADNSERQTAQIQ